MTLRKGFTKMYVLNSENKTKETKSINKYILLPILGDNVV